MSAKAQERKRILKYNILLKRIMSESSTASSRTAVALKSTELDRVSEEGDNICCPFFCALFFHSVLPGTSSQARKDKQACESNLACLGSRRRQGLEKEQARKNKQAFNSSSNELKACLFMGNVL